MRQGIYTRCSLFGVCLGSHGACFPEGGDKSDAGLGYSKEEHQGRTFSYLGCTLGQCESAIEGVICHVESQRPRWLQTETFSWNPNASASVTASVKALLRIPTEIRRHQACAHETQETITVGVSIIYRVRHLACGNMSTGSPYP